MDGRWSKECGRRNKDFPRFVQKKYYPCLNVDAIDPVLPWHAHAKKVELIAQSVVNAGKNVKNTKMISIPHMTARVTVLVKMRLIQAKNKLLESYFYVFSVPLSAI